MPVTDGKVKYVWAGNIEEKELLSVINLLKKAAACHTKNKRGEP